ncbi:toxin-antitoxin system HicB family antitoxin [Rugamonas aquatica]|uniref:Toxin-antitoxin system HicB family antitoxin n=1 Tax=Rugamonas aquatica TaxID=2743357 RepID=A0A6A7N1R7_9BURK|nr:toxin-antitoxin system HicB family antitoxin [Rugamonas aquatica]MQA39009.1 toxin-antitoxin system HicB family antitoxin [Rugamonas aquatica]
MKKTKSETGTVAFTIRISTELHTQLVEAAARQAWSINAEINHRLRAGPVLAQIQTLTEEISTLKKLVRDRQGNSSD